MLPVLIVEDNPAFGSALQAALKARFPFLDLTTATGAQQAMEDIDALHPELIFMDVVLPDGNGLEITKRLRASGNNAKVIVMSSHDIPEYGDEAIRCGANHFIGKSSLDLGELFALVDAMLAH